MESTKRVPRIVLAVCALTLALAGALMLAGCSRDVAVEIGEENDDSLEMKFYNSTGLDITEVAVKLSGDEDADFGDAMVFDGDETWDYGSYARIYCDAYETTVEETSDGTDVEVTAGYDIQLTYGDGTTGVLHGVTFSEADSVVVQLDDETGLTYMEYISEDDEIVYTLESETAVHEAEEAAAAEATAAEAAAEEE